MEKFHDSLYIGNIMKRTWCETEHVGPNTVRGGINCYVQKENAILYRTKNNGYVDLDDITKKSDYKKVDSVIISDTSETSKNGIEVMPAVELSKVEIETNSWGSRGTLGLFVDSESLISYKNIKNQDNIIKKTR